MPNTAVGVLYFRPKIVKRLETALPSSVSTSTGSHEHSVFYKGNLGNKGRGLHEQTNACSNLFYNSYNLVIHITIYVTTSTLRYRIHVTSCAPRI